MLQYPMKIKKKLYFNTTSCLVFFAGFLYFREVWHSWTNEFVPYFETREYYFQYQVTDNSYPKQLQSYLDLP